MSPPIGALVVQSNRSLELLLRRFHGPADRQTCSVKDGSTFKMFLPCLRIYPLHKRQHAVFIFLLYSLTGMLSIMPARSVTLANVKYLEKF